MFTDPSDHISAQLTMLGREMLARSLAGTVSFKLVNFAVGIGGYHVLNPVKTTPIQSDLSELEYQVWPDPNAIVPRQPFSLLEFPNPNAIAVTCRLGPDDANFGLGEIGVWARVVHSNVPSEINSEFLFMVAHLPIQAKTDRHIYVLRLVCQL